MHSEYVIALLFSLAAAFSCMLGIYIVRYYRKWGLTHIKYFVCFAAGVLITVSILHLIPKSLVLNHLAPFFVMLGYFFMHLVSRYVDYNLRHEPKAHTNYKFGLIPAIGVGFHSFLDGIIYSVTVSVGTLTGGVAAIGMVLHEFPEGIMTYLLLLSSGFSKRRSFWLAFFMAGMTTPLGTLVSFPFVSELSQSVLGLMLALSGGILLYVGATHLLPDAEREPKRYSFMALLAGIVIAYFMIHLGG